ncbi:MAG: HAMP domain-containing protein [Dehalococcoidia bacterium]|nr:HAMP domain-containing protein [Dehalococcoidia bacterium]
MQLPPFSRTVRFRLTIWYSSLLLVFGVAFVVALNLAARLDRPDVYTVAGYEYQPIPVGGGRAVLAPSAVTLEEVEDNLYSQNLDQLKIWSLFAVVGLAIASGVGGYVLSGMMLQPVRDITRVASRIGATNLHQRINHQGADDEMKALADTFDSMIGRLEESFEQQRQFVQDASHELRTPLAAIRTNIEVTEMDPDATVEEYRSLMETVKTQTARLTRLSEDLLLLTTAERQVELEPVAALALAREVARELSPLAAMRGVRLQIEGDAAVEAMASGDLLYRCVFNLVDNAIKYGGEDGVVGVRIARTGDAVSIRVSDSGPGIEAGQLEHVFERFYRIDKGRSRREGGTGLGLSIVREIVRSMQGEVSAESTPGQGSTFAITLPVAEDEAPTGAAERLVFGHA